MIMKKNLLYIIFALLSFVSCKYDLTEEVRCNVSLSPENTYLAGTPVRFNIEGNADNIVFYSGENGSQYIYKDRYTVPIEQIKSAKLQISYLAQYGKTDGGLDVYVSKSFNGLKGNDGEADRTTIRTIVDGGMQGWTKLEYNEVVSKTVTHEYDITDYLDNFAIAIHWHPTYDGVNAQRSYFIQSRIDIEILGSNPTSMKLTDLAPVTVMMNEQQEPYRKNDGNGSIRFDNLTKGEISFQGVGGKDKKFNYSLDGWVFTTPSALNKIQNDKGVVIKNLQNYMDSYEYIYPQAGTYTATFVCKNANYQGASKSVQEVKFTIVDKTE